MDQGITASYLAALVARSAPGRPVTMEFRENESFRAGSPEGFGGVASGGERGTRRVSPMTTDGRHKGGSAWGQQGMGHLSARTRLTRANIRAELRTRPVSATPAGGGRCVEAAIQFI